MSWKTINRILGLASINTTFQQQLQRNPAQTLEEYEFELTSEELEVFSKFAPLPFPLFCARLFEQFALDEKE